MNHDKEAPGTGLKQVQAAVTALVEDVFASLQTIATTMQSFETGSKATPRQRDRATWPSCATSSSVNCSARAGDPRQNLQMPVTTVAANPSTVYVADQRGVLQLSGSGAEDHQSWSEVRPFMTAGALPVLPG